MSGSGLPQQILHDLMITKGARSQMPRIICFCALLYHISQLIANTGKQRPVIRILLYSLQILPADDQGTEYLSLPGFLRFFNSPGQK